MNKNRFVKYSFGLLLVVMILALGLVAGGRYYLGRSLAPLDGSIVVQGITHKVEIFRDKTGVPHIFAKNKKDALWALGHTMASERLFQMEVYRRLGAGRLSEIFGEKARDLDILMRSFRLKKSMVEYLEKNWESLSPQMKQESQAFYDGINYYIAHNPLPIEFTLLGFKPGPFSIQDSVGLVGYMAFSFACSLKMDLLFSSLLSKIPFEMVNEIRIEPEIIGKTSVGMATPDVQFDWTKIAQIQSQFISLGAFEGSNSWVVSGARSTSGKPILANDPHIGFSLPGIWFEAHLNSPDYEMYGHFLPGIPFPILGHNRNYAWAITMSEIDDMDFYKEEVDWGKKLVKYKGNWVAMNIEDEIIKIKGADDYHMSLAITPHGPMVGSFLKDKPLLSLKWSFLHPDNRVIESLYAMGTAHNMQEFKQAVSYGGGPGLNISYADGQGNIGWWVLGFIPKRPKGLRNDFILSGNDGSAEYQGYLKFDENPHLVNPENGVIITANYRSQGSNSDLRGNWEPPDRQQTIENELAKKKVWSVDDFKHLQIANIGSSFRSLKAQMLNYLAKSIVSLSPLEHQVYNILSDWDGESSMSKPGPLIFYHWMYLSLRQIMDELTDQEFEIYTSIPPHSEFFKRILKNPESKWWDVKATHEVTEVAADVMKTSFVATVQLLLKRYGEDVSKWQWGTDHTVEYVHPLGRQSPLNYIFNLGPYPVMGGYNQINNFRWVGVKDEFKVKAGPSTRRIIDMAAPDVSWGGLPIGISGHRMSPFFQNQLQDFLQGKHQLQILGKEKIEAEKSHLLSLIPKT